MEPYTIPENIGGERSVIFGRAEEKAVKTIQKHSININGVEYNKQIEKAYLLLGKSRYFDGHFLLALNTFNDFITKYPQSKLLAEVFLWREKINIKLDYPELAVKNLEKRKSYFDDTSSEYANYYALLSEAYIQAGNFEQGLYAMKKAAVYTKNPKIKKGRYLFITAQLYESLDSLEMAKNFYEKINKLDRKTKRRYGLHSKLKIIRMKRKKDTTGTFNEFLKLAKKNKYKRQRYNIYRTMGKAFLEEDGKKGIIYLNKSLRAKEVTQRVKILNYTDIKEYYSIKKKFYETGLYLDSLLQNLPKNTKEYLLVEKEYKSLEKIVTLENNLREMDSVLSIIKKSEAEQRKIFTQYIEKKQKKEISNLGYNDIEANNSFYFYNTKLVLQGKRDFEKTWGRRPNVDNWRNAAIFQGALYGEENTAISKSKNNQIFKETPESYMVLLPKTGIQIDSLKKRRNKIIFNLAVIYKRIDSELSAKYFRSVLLYSASAEEKSKILFHLAEIYKLKAPNKSKAYKEEILREYPNTIAAKFILDPKVAENIAWVPEREIDKKYWNLLQLYLAGSYLKVLQKSDSIMSIYAHPNLSKIALLRARVLGRIKGIDTLEKELKNIVKKYSKAEEKKYATKTLLQLDSIKKHTSQSLEDNYVNGVKWVFPFSTEEKKRGEEMVFELSKMLKEEKKVSMDIYDKDTFFVVIHGFRDNLEIKKWKKNKKNNYLERKSYVFLPSFYKAKQIFKNWHLK